MALTRIKTDQILDGTITGDDIASGTDIASNNLTLSGDLRGPSIFTIDPAAIGDNTGTVVIAGDLQVDGTTTTINSSTLTVDDKQIVIASGATDNTSADGAGILIDGANATITYDGTNDRFEINKDVQIIGGSITGTDVDVSGATFTVANDQISGDAINGGTATPTTLNTTNLNVDSGTLFVDSVNNRVGVGTSSPSEALDVNGNIDLNDNTLYFAKGTSARGIGYKVEGGSDLTVFSDADIFFTESDSDNVVFRIDVNNQVTTAYSSMVVKQYLILENQLSGSNYAIKIPTQGPGTEAINVRSDPFDGISSNIRFRQSGSGGSNTPIIFSAFDSTNQAIFIDPDDWEIAGADKLIFSTGSTIGSCGERMRIDSSGNVGIGTSNPNTTLDVNGDIRAKNSRILPDGSIADGDASAPHYSFYLDQDTGVFRASGDTLGFSTGGSEAMRIDSSGRVGIGTSSPSKKLEVLGGDIRIHDDSLTRLEWFNDSDAIDPNDYWIAEHNNNGDLKIMRRDVSAGQWGNNLILGADGNVGIGTSSPNAKLDVDGDLSVGSIDLRGNRIWLSGLQNNTGDYLDHQTLEGITYYENGSPAWRLAGGIDDPSFINNGNNLGIGTTTPDAKIDIKSFGISGAKLLRFETDRPWHFAQENTGPSTNLLLEAESNSKRFKIRNSAGQNIASFFGSDSGNTVTINGSLSKNSGSFKIDHPLPEKSETHNLVHSFVESPRADNVYRGTVTLSNGTAQVNLDAYIGMTEGTFSALNGNIDVFLQNKTGWEPLKGEVIDNILHVYCRDETATDTISWMVVGERQDQHMLDTKWTDEFGRPILEPEKEIEQEIPDDE